MLHQRNKQLTNGNRELSREATECQRVVRLKSMRCEKAEKSVEVWREKG